MPLQNFAKVANGLRSLQNVLHVTFARRACSLSMYPIEQNPGSDEPPSLRASGVIPAPRACTRVLLGKETLIAGLVYV